MKRATKDMTKGDGLQKVVKKKHPQKMFAALFAGVHDSMCLYTQP